MFEIIGNIFNVCLYQPLLNFLVLLYNFLGNFGLSIIVLTLIIKVATNPLNKKSLESQKKMTEMQPLIKELQKKYKDKEQQGRELLKLYQEHKFNPFAGILVLFLQLPILWALFRVFQAGIEISKIGPFIYSFIPVPEIINPMFLSIDLSQPSILIAIITAVTQFIQVKTTPMQPAKKEGDKEKDQMEQMTEMIQKQTLFIIPIITFFVLFKLPAALGLYWMLTTILNIFQQRKIFNKK
ncbi:MAG: YidC/Oxa1 family membrane protein insertase [Candidatus Pacebacteria bacterium]|nr:YidC/Oxa1 family membrane protein insertase [Candidatus Paceibacterota bacterium]MDD5012864.1 YidC/Oxa1 family membrane protein insertase [Candidatus Paceibacterota bacterium]MDD5752795.1 YidC/Oxa1 family membrane protein insertase [Candidatus Paceibacterota bacterium]